MPRLALLATLALTLATTEALAADIFRTRQGARVAPLSATAFEVAPRNPGAGGAAYWCAASEYVTRGLRLPWETPITITRTRGMGAVLPRGYTVAFEAVPGAPAPERRGVTSLNAVRVGDTMTASHAATYCHHVVRSAP